MLEELKGFWKESKGWEKLLIIILLPFSILTAIAYGLWLMFWNKYGLAFICALAILGSANEEPATAEVWEKAQAMAMLVGLVLLAVRAYKKSKKE